MNKQILELQLEELGLSEDEIALYLFLLEHGTHTPLEASRGSGLNRSKIYRIVDVLKAKGLISESPDGWGRTIQATDPSNLELLLFKKEKDLESQRGLLPSLIETLASFGSSTGTDFEVKHYKGVEGLKQMLWNELRSKEILTFDQGNINPMVGKTFGEKMRQEAVNRKQKIFAITNSSTHGTETNVDGYDEKVFFERNVSKDLLHIQHHIDIYGNAISIYNWKDTDTPAGIEIINKPLADMYRQMFWHYWEMAEGK